MSSDDEEPTSESTKETIIKPIDIVLKELPDAMESIVYVKEKWPMIIDTTGQATRFLKYQTGNFHNAISPDEMSKESLRKSLVGCLKYGHDMTIDLGSTGLELEQFWDPNHFPKELLYASPLVVNTPEFWTPLLRKDLGDPEPEKFETRDGFRLIIVSSNVESPPPITMSKMGVLRVVESKTKVSGGKDAELALACGVKLVKRNQKKLCEAAFEGELDEVKSWLEKGYDLESVDAHDHTPLSEAAAKGHMNVVEFLLDQGSDPNAVNDTGRSPLYRAAFHGHLEMVKLLLQAGGDPRLRAGEETPESIAKDDQVKNCIKEWDLTITDRLIEERIQKMKEKLESRILTAVEREAIAKTAINKELVELATKGDERAFMDRIEELTMEALNNREKPRGKCMARDERGNTLLMIAAAKNHLDLAKRLLTHWLTLDPEFDADERKLWYVNVNARDNKGWNATCIAAFHCHRSMLELLLEHGGDPTARNVYGKNSFWFGQDELDNGETMILRDRSEVREVLNAWEGKRIQKLMEAGASEEEAKLSGNVAVAKVEEKKKDKESANGETKEKNDEGELDPENMEKDEIKAELKKRKLDTKGKKKDLVKRLTDVLNKEKKEKEKANEPLIPSKMKLKDVRAALKERKLDTKGNKDNLVKRLEDALKKESKGKKGGGKKKKASKYAVKKH
jgi:ankyrin repeat protein